MTRTLTLLLSVGLTAAAPSGHPDLSGVWNFSSGVPLQRPATFAARKLFTREEFDSRRTAILNALTAIARFMPVENVGLEWIDTKLYVEDLRTSLITYPDNGRLPELVEGVRRVPGPEDIFALLADAKGGAAKDSYRDFSAAERCLATSSPPLVPQFGDNYVQIVQAADHVAIVSDGERRLIAVNGRQPASSVRSSSGTSTGRWEGDTLVVETKNFDSSTPSFAGAGSALHKFVTERFTRTSADRLQYSATITDPKTFTNRIELSFPMSRVDVRIFEAACHEGNYSLANTLSGLRKAEIETTPAR